MTAEVASKRARTADGQEEPVVATSLSAKATLSNGVEMPFVGLGTYLQNDEEAELSVKFALKLGYRHIDTAEYYANHAGIARAIRASGVARDEIFITDKLSPGGIFGQPGKSYEATLAALRRCLDILQTDYVDLYLIHHPGARHERLEQWRALCDAQDSGLARAVGVSNFSRRHLEEIRAAGLRMPEVNQIEIHPLCTQTDLIGYLKTQKILPVAYSSLAPCSGWRVEEGQASAKSAEHAKQLSLLESLTSKHKVSQAQVLLRWALQKGYPILPKSSQASRVQTNSELFHFELDDEDVSALDGLDENAALAWPVGNPLDWE